MSNRRHHGHHRGCSPLCTSVRHDLLELSNHLRQERLYVQHEKVQLQELNAKVKAASEKLSNVAWITHRQRENLDGLIFSYRGQEISALKCCQRANNLEQTEFQDAYKQLGHHEIAYSEFLRTLRCKPKLLAHCLTVGDKLSLPVLPEILSTVFSGIYGSCVMGDDEKMVLKLLRQLMKTQLTSAANPRKLLRQGTCAFIKIYKFLSEELFSAKLFLTSALYEPILGLLSDDEIFLDIDPSKTAIRFPPSDRLRKFGREGTPEYDKNVSMHREFVISKLETLTNSFIQGIRDNLHCFPPSLARLLRSMYRLLMSSGRAEPREVNAVCVDVIFYLFICPAMVDPNPVGIIDTPISYIARSNLMQVAQILQVLALWKWEEIDPRLMDLYSKFDKEAMSSVLEVMLESANDLATSDDDDDFSGADEQDLNSSILSNAYVDHHIANDISPDTLSSSPRLMRQTILLTRSQLEQLITFLRQVQDSSNLEEIESISNAIDIADLKNVLATIPEKLPGKNNTAKTQQPSSSTPSTSPTKSKLEDSFVALASKKQMLTHKLSNVATSVQSKASALSSNISKSVNSSLLDDGQKQCDTNGPDHLEHLSPTTSSDCLMIEDPETVMVIPLYPCRNEDPPGFLTEEQVISRSRQTSGSRVVRMNLANLPGEDDGGGRHGRHSGGGGAVGVGGNSEENSSLVSGAGEKRTRFSISHDDGSIGNTSDNLEAISEAASNHSVDSSLEDEDDPAEDPIIDNLSDMVSANVSGRGTPNVSGRDTPSSQVTEGDELVGAGGREAVGPEPAAEPPEEPRDVVDEGGEPPLAQQIQGPAEGDPSASGNRGRKNGEPDLEEKFGRFEIKRPARTIGLGGANVSMQGAAGSEQGDETVSLISDTWSTDVLASDTETLGDLDGNHQQMHLFHHRRQVRNAGLGLQVDLGGNRLLDDLVEHHENTGRVVRPGIEGSSGSLGSASAANLLDVSETGSEAWSIDVLASDTESLRLAELDNEDTASVARSDDTRFTDDTTRSDPEGLDLGAPHSASGGAASGPGQVGGGFSNPYNRHRRDDVTLVRRGVSNDGNLLRPSRAAAVEQWARQSGGPRASLIPRRGSECSGGRAGSFHEHVRPKAPAAGANEGEVGSRQPDGQPLSQNPLGFMTTHMSAASIASSTESSAGESGTGFSVTTVAVASGSGMEDTIFKSSGATEMDSLSSNDETRRCLMDTELEVATGAPVVTSTSPDLSATSSKLPETQMNQPSQNTGAIPKSISFEKTVGRNSRNGVNHFTNSSSSRSVDWPEHRANDHSDQSHQGSKNKKRDTSFFKSWKLPKIGRNRNVPGGPSASLIGSRGRPGEDPNPPEEAHLPDHLLSDEQGEATVESSDDILAKYRRRIPTSSAEGADDDLPSSSKEILHGGNRPRDHPDFISDDDRLVIDPANIEASFAFQDAKRKLRMMLSEADLHILSSLPMSHTTGKTRSNELVWLLRVQLAEAHNLQNRSLVAQLHETLRCLSLFDNENCRKLVRSLKEDYKRRAPYMTYLVRCRQSLLTTLAQQERLLSRLELDRQVCASYLVSVCVRLFLERRELELARFVNEFRDASAADEKTALMERLLSNFWSQLESDPSSSVLWSLLLSQEQQELCRLTVERAIVAQIYVLALFPNGEADVSRDAVLSQHIKRLSEEITPGHRDLRIPRQYHYEQPWPSAQAELRRLAAYKTPQDKVSCIVRCSQTIMNLLSIASSKSVPAADDFIPVMVFVIIKANPPSLLSTVQYVDSFYGSRLSGEDQYWWMQFASAIEFIKTMDYH